MSQDSRLTHQSKNIKADQHSRKRHRSQLVAITDSNSSSRGGDGSQVSPRGEATRSQSPRHFVVRFHISGLSR